MSHIRMVFQEEKHDRVHNTNNFDGLECPRETTSKESLPGPSLTELVIVCGHAICKNPRRPFAESSWLLAPFQVADTKTGKVGEHHTFMQHISAGANALRRPNTLLVCSGGKTQEDCDIAEGYSYVQVIAHEKGLYGPMVEQAIVDDRVVAECYASDSYQNLLFSIICFWVKVGQWPEMVTVITHAFKQDRFLESHAEAVRWPRDKIRVQGINPPFTRDELSLVQASEAKCMNQFKGDPYGVRPPLADKKSQRRWHIDSSLQGLLEEVTNVEARAMLEKLLFWKGGKSGRDVYPHELPWDRNNSGTGSQ